MAVKLSPIFNDAQNDSNGDPLSGGKLYTYAAGSTTNQATYTDSDGGTAHANPIILDSRGEPSSPIWLTEGLAYKFVLKDSGDVTIRTVDNISGVNETTTLTNEWIASGSTPTFISGTSFSVLGDKTSDFHVGRRLKLQVTAGTKYATITATAFTSLTTVTVVVDSGSLDSGLDDVQFSLLRNDNLSTPKDLKADTISESISAGGVTIDGVWLKDNGITASGTSDIDGGTIDGVTIGGNSAGAGTFTTLNATGGGALTGTWTNLGTVSTVDINGGTLDGVTIGGSSAAAANVTTLDASTRIDINSTQGMDVNPGSDADADLITVGVTGTPIFKWDESENAFSSNKGLNVTSGVLSIKRSANVPVLIDRDTNDGQLIQFRRDGSEVGDITVSSGTVSLTGSHLSRRSHINEDNLLRGTVLSNLNQRMDGDDFANLNKVKVSDTASDNGIAGVLDSYRQDGDIRIAMKGDYFVRIAKGVTVGMNDLLESAGDGTGKPQADDVVRSSTLGKVNIVSVVETYPDGSWLCPIILY